MPNPPAWILECRFVGAASWFPLFEEPFRWRLLAVGIAGAVRIAHRIFERFDETKLGPMSVRVRRLREPGIADGPTA